MKVLQNPMIFREILWLVEFGDKKIKLKVLT